MKFLRNLAVIVLTTIFLATFAIGIGIIFSVQNVNVTLLSYQYDSDSKEARGEIALIKEEVLKVCKGNVIAFVDDSEIISCIDEGYVVESVEKIYPCTVNITVRQRQEVYVIAKEEGFSVYDENGNYLKDAETLLNSLDSAPNVLIEGTQSEQDVKTVAETGKKFKERFNSIRSTVESITLENAKTNLAEDKIIFVLRCGIKIEIQGFGDGLTEKIDEAFREFSSLSGEQKLKGTIYCFRDFNGDVTRIYDPN